jgi:hypothetical protein
VPGVKPVYIYPGVYTTASTGDGGSTQERPNLCAPLIFTPGSCPVWR